MNSRARSREGRALKESHIEFPSVHWPIWNSAATFEPGDRLPAAASGNLWAVLAFLYYGDRIVLADIRDRGLCIPSGRLEPGESLEAAMERECYEEAGARLREDHRALIGCYRLQPRDDSAQPKYCPVFVAEALGFEPIPDGSESRGVFLAAEEDVQDLYFTWDPLMESVFAYASRRRQELLPAGTPIGEL
jgi:8-oxo-dGTP diphosphatase